MHTQTLKLFMLLKVSIWTIEHGNEKPSFCLISLELLSWGHTFQTSSSHALGLWGLSTDFAQRDSGSWVQSHSPALRIGADGASWICRQSRVFFLCVFGSQLVVLRDHSGWCQGLTWSLLSARHIEPLYYHQPAVCP